MNRADPFGSLDDFAPKTATKPVKHEQIEQIAQENGFPSRQALRTDSPSAKSRRYTTGRNQQINIKAKPETIAQMNRLADALEMPLGEVLERALAAFEAGQGSR